MIGICGDSFCGPDADYPCTIWAEQIPNVVNYSFNCASNTLISQQVDCALATYPQFVIVCFTSCTRGEIVDDKNNIIPFTRMNKIGDRLSNAQRDAVELYNKHIFDLNIEIYRNKCIIESILQKLVDSGVPFLFDQGGFEHKIDTSYFEKYKSYRSKWCLWDHGDSHQFRPTYHIQDQDIHNQIADYYNRAIIKATTKDTDELR